jgi:hypothetical protein
MQIQMRMTITLSSLFSTVDHSSFSAIFWISAIIKLIDDSFQLSKLLSIGRDPLLLTPRQRLPTKQRLRL